MLEENSVSWLLLRHVAPPAVTVVVGGALTYLLFPALQARFERSRQRARRRSELAEEVAERFQRYLAAWRRLISIARLERTRALGPEEQARKALYVEQRGEARDALFATLARCRFYISPHGWATVEAFLEWDDRQAAKRLEELPAIDAWREEERRVIECLRSEL